jgi:hypothetical protein
MLSHYPRADQIRDALLTNTAAMAVLMGLPVSAVSKMALNDTSFIHKVAQGGNFTIESYDRMMSWIDKRMTLYERQIGFVKRVKVSNSDSKGVKDAVPAHKRLRRKRI